MILLAITPGLGFEAQAWRRVLLSGVDAFLIREKDLGTRELLEAARWCQDTAPAVQLWVGGRLDVALAAGCGLHAPEAYPVAAANAHLGLPPLSRPLHDEGQWASRQGVQQLLVSPIYPSPGKAQPWGAQRLHTFLDGLPAEGPRVLALGGLEPIHRATLAHPRLDGFAAIRPFWTDDPQGAVARFRGR